LINAAVSGVVLSRNIEPGEVLQPGAVALILAQLDRLTITVYIPEDRYGEISLGAVAQVRIDSFPGQTFMATVTRIADQAEFTPRNVATAAGRRTTVFAVELAVNDTAGQLKPGMPATVVFDR
jgi:HlyD family secretion protein